MYGHFLGKLKLNVWMGILLGLVISSWGISSGFPGGPLVVEAQQTSIPPEVLAYPNMIAYNGQVLTVDDAFSTAQAFAVRDGKFLVVGTNQRITALAGPETRKIDLKGRTVVPGFIDTHNHYNGYVERGMMPRVIFQTREQWVADIKKLVDAAEPGEWIILRSERNVNQSWAESSFSMTRHDLDPISPNNPVFVWTSPPGNDAIINSYALRLANMPADISGLVKDPETGEPTGFVDQEAYGRVFYEMLPWPDIEELLPLYKAAMKKFNSQGKTTAGARFPAHVITVFKTLWERGEATLRMRVFHEFARVAYRPEAIIKRVGNLNGLGDAWLKIAAANIGNPDGAAGRGRGWTRKPKMPAMSHAKDPSAPDYGYVPYYEDRQASDWKTIPILSRYGWRILGIHTAGDRSVDELIAAYEEANREKSIVGRRHGIDHSLMIRPEHIEAAKRLGLVAGAEENTAEGTERLAQIYGADEVFKISPIRSMIDAGIIVGMEGLGNTGFDEAGSEKTPLWFIETFVRRADIETGKVWNESERVTRQQALQMSTIWAAYYLGDEKILGSIEPGKLADFVVLDGDYMEVPEDKISDLKAIMTVIDGRVVYEVPGQF
ncbi:amidohydrolase family protein [Acidobacteria bacterium AH-259-D05]|nr:amidohydrolase family protein [Acidobacteria bacterium AH-259-D05]